MTDQSSDDATDAELIEALKKSPIVAMMSAMGLRDVNTFRRAFRAGFFAAEDDGAVGTAYWTAYDATAASWSGDPAWAQDAAARAGLEAALAAALAEAFGPDDDPL